MDWNDRAHFLAAAARIMRHVLIDLARGRGCQRRGARAMQVPLEPDALATDPRSVGLTALDEALNDGYDWGRAIGREVSRKLPALRDN